MRKAVTFGEIMIRLNPEGYKRFVQADKMEVCYSGGEANVSVSLANYGVDTSFVSKVPSNEIGQAAINELRRFGVDVRSIVRGGTRIGIYFYEKGASQRPSKVIYDRGSSSISLAEPTDFNWNQIFEGADWFHFTGITPALKHHLPEICLEACRTAKEKGLTVSCDLNYRKKLWTRDEAREVMTTLMPYVDVCIGNEEDADDVFGIRASGSDIKNGKLSKSGYIDVAKQLTERFGFQYTAITLRSSVSANDNLWAGMLYKDGEAYFSTEYPMHIVDRVGGGDSFSGGLIYALGEGYLPQDAVDFAVAASCLKHSVEHDFNMVSVAEVLSLMNGNASGRIQR